MIDLVNPEQHTLYVIENEIISHDPFKHVGIQLLKFATSFVEGKLTVRNFLMNEITKNSNLLNKLEKACSGSIFRNIDNYLDAALCKDFKAIVVIDEARPELHNVLEKIRADISVIELKAYINDTGEFFYQFGTLYDELDEDIVTCQKLTDNSVEALEIKRNRRARCDTIVVPVREEGLKKVFLGEHRWYAIRIGAAMKDKIKFIASYEKSPISAITHLARVKGIRPYKDTGKYEVLFEAPAETIPPVKLQDSNMSPQGPVYVEQDKLINAKSLDELLK